MFKYIDQKIAVIAVTGSLTKGMLREWLLYNWHQIQWH